MFRRRGSLLVAAMVAVFFCSRSASGGPGATVGTTGGAVTPGSTATFVLPETLADVHGRPVDVAALAQKHTLFVITLKATWCPVCQQQLVRLNRLLPRLRSCGASFIVLAPPPAPDLRAIQERTGFPYPFVADERLDLARAAGLVLAPDQIEPAILGVDETRAVVWTQRGRSAASFGDDELLAYLRCGSLSDA